MTDSLDIKNGDIIMRLSAVTRVLLFVSCFSITNITTPVNAPLSFGFYSIPAHQPGPGEDTYANIGNSYFGIFDGHKGNVVANHLAENLLPLIKKNIENLQASKDIKRAITAAFQEEDNNMRRTQNMQPYSGAPGATIIQKDGQFYIANVGSTRVFVIQKNKPRVWVSRNHVVNDPREEDRIKRERGSIRTDSSSTKTLTDACTENICEIHKRASRSFGDFYWYQQEDGKMVLVKPRGLSAIPDITRFNRKNIEAIVVVTDGIWRPYEDLKQLEQFMKKLIENNNLSPEEIAKEIIFATQKKVSDKNQEPDDMTVLVIKFGR